jgi:molybdenum-dependent DNA-binding transcriptional regulator ModE
MCPTEHAAIARAGRTVRCRERRAALLNHLANGEGIKQAAWLAGIAYRTARRYRQEAR